MLDFALSSRLPALDEIDPKFRIGGIEWHVRDETEPMVHPALAVFTLIIGHTTRSLGLSDLLEQKRVVPLFYPQDVTHVVLLQGLNMRGIRTEAIFGDDHLEMGVIPTKFADETLGRVALAIIFLGAILLDNGLRHQGNDFALVRVNKGRAQHLVGISDSAISVVLFQTRVAVNRFGGKIARAIEG